MKVERDYRLQLKVVIINDMEAETVSIPIRDAFCGEVKKLDKEPLVRQDL